MRKIKGKKFLIFILLILTVVLSACTSSPDFEQYEGKPLRIAVVGTPPEVKEEQVKFTEISFDEMTNEELKPFDAVFIMENNLFKASQFADVYADVYLHSNIPFFFIGANDHIPFIVKDTRFNGPWNWIPGESYAVGIFQKNDTLNQRGYGLYNDEKTDEYIADVYSRIFKAIDEEKR